MKMRPAHKLKTVTPNLSLVEFSALCAFMIALVAMSIDIVLPGLGQMGQDLGAPSANAAQNILTALFIGLAIGQIIFGPISDSTGRKAAIYVGTVLFLGGCLLSYFAKSFEMMLAGRFLQGFGAAGPRIIIMAVIRDQYEGRAMARITSIIMGFFILVPMIAPSLGQLLMLKWSWHILFAFLFIFAILVTAWFSMRQPETLPQERRRPFTAASIGKGLWEVVKTRVSFGYTIAAGLIFGAFNCYLISSQQIFADIFDIHETYALYFGGLAIPIAIAGFLNSVLVMRFGMRSLCRLALYISAGLSGMFLLAAFLNGGVLPLSAFLIWAVVSFFTMGLMFGNVNAIAMEPLGHLAGIGAAVIGSLSTLMSGIIGWYVGSKYDETLIPLIGGFSVLAALSLITIYIADKGRVPTQYTEDGQIIDTDNTQS